MISEVHLSPQNPSGFLKRLCHHFSLKIPAEYDEEKGHADFPMGRCEMTVQDDQLILRAQADDQKALDTVKDIVGQHVVLFGKRENLQVDWADQEAGSSMNVWRAQ